MDDSRAVFLLIADVSVIAQIGMVPTRAGPITPRVVGTLQPGPGGGRQS